VNKEKINIELTKDEAIVLFEFLAELNKKDNQDLFSDQAEQRVLWDIECDLEKQLSEPFSADYLEIVRKAREKIRGKE
jgi:hypothetical protein